MGLTEQQKRWNESVEEAWRNRNKKTSQYKISFNSSLQDLYEELQNKILQINSENISIVERGNYTSFKIKSKNQSFVDIQIQKSVIKCIINLKKGKLKLIPQLRDISRLGHFGSGDYEATIKSKEGIKPLMECIKKSYNRIL
jgi:predicted transport protein